MEPGWPWAAAAVFPQVSRGRWDRPAAHIHSVAQRAYWALLSQRRDQGLVTLGRSGAGKTACCEQVLEHLVAVAGSVDGRVSGAVASGCRRGGRCVGTGLLLLPWRSHRAGLSSPPATSAG
jgi:hypothetical protein